MKFNEILNKVFGKVFKNVDWLNVSPAVYVRYILAIIAAINSLLNVFGVNPINVDQSQLYDVISAILFIAILFINTYKDNPTSAEAIESNKYLQMLKAGEKKKIVDDVEETETTETTETK